MVAEAPDIDTDLLVEAFDCLRIALAVFDGGDRLVYANQHLVRTFPSMGPDAGALGGTSFADLVAHKLRHGEIGGQGALQEPEAWMVHRLSFHRAGSKRSLTMQLADGRWIEASERPTPGGGIIVSWTDISQTKQGQMRLEDAIVSSTDGYALWDATGRLSMCNRPFADRIAGENAARLVGLRLADVLGLGLRNRTLDIEGPADQWLETKVIEHRRPQSDTIIRTTGNRWLRVSSRRTRDGGTITMLSDISDEHEREMEFADRATSLTEAGEKLEQQRRQLDDTTVELVRTRDVALSADASRTRFLRSMSHELRTPLNSIIGFAEVLDKQLFGPLGSDRYKEYAGMVVSSGQHLLTLINRILDLSRLEAGRYTITPEPHNIAHLIEEAVSMVSRSAELKDVSMTISEGQGTPDVLADETALRQVVLNLLSNAIKFTGRGGSVEVRIEADDGGVMVTVEDNGVGIGDGDLERVMLPFEQAQASAADNRDGVGLGLPIARSLVELHGGTLRLHSEQGAGTRAEVWLPRADLVRRVLVG